MQFGCGPVDLHIKPWNLGPIPEDHFVSCWVSFLFEKKWMLTPTLSYSLSCFVTLLGVVMWSWSLAFSISPNN
jgi:hypothetical protein